MKLREAYYGCRHKYSQLSKCQDFVISTIPSQYSGFVYNLCIHLVLYNIRILFGLKSMETRLYLPDWPSSASSPASSPATSPSPDGRVPTPYLPITPPPPLQRRQQYFTSRDDRLRVQTLHEIGWKKPAIARQTGLTYN
jgi:hypothetical protein